MAERRMVSKKVTDDDRFVNLSSSAQALYLHLSMNADDDGFCNQVSASMFKAHASIQDLEALLSSRYIYQFESGVIVIKHWRMANALRKDRYTPTAFKEELAQLKLKDNGVYSMADHWQPNGNQCLPQDRLDKVRLDKVNITPPTPPGETLAGFDEFWKNYPRKVGKEAAKKAFRKVRVPVEILIEAIGKQAETDQWKRGYIPNPATWLNQGRWEDETEQKQTQAQRCFVPTEF